MGSIKTGAVIFIGAILAGCHSWEKVKTSFPAQALYFDYQISGSEEQDAIACTLKYRQGGVEGRGVFIDSPGRVSIDGEVIKADSTPKTGFYYEMEKPTAEFIGSHRIELIDEDQKRYTEEIDFHPFGLVEELPKYIKRKPFVIRIKNFPADGNLRLVLADTSSRGNGVNELVQVKGGEIGINQFMVDRLKSGPVLLKLYLEEEKVLKNVTSTGGILTVLYSLERDFELSD